MKQITVIVETAPHNLSAYLDGIDGIVTTGKDISEIKRNMKEAILLYIDTCKEFHEEIPEPFKGKYELIFKFQNS